MRGGTNGRSFGPGRLRLSVLLPPLLVVAAIGVLLVYFSSSPGKETVRDADLCPEATGGISDSSVFLVDLSKPLEGDRGTLPGALLRQVTMGMAADAELRVFLLTDSAASPRAMLSRLCKPYSNADLDVDAAKDRASGTLRDCDDLPAQIPPTLRRSARRFCALRTALQRRLDRLASQTSLEDMEPPNAFLVEAIEDIRLDLRERPAPHALYVFSDMMQHARWYSHLEMEWEDWDYQQFSRLLLSQPWVFRPSGEGTPMRVEVFYVPRAGWTDQPRASRLHQQFWYDYFANADVTFHVLPALPAYTARPLMSVRSDAQMAAEERAAAAELLRRIQREQESLRREQQELVKQAEQRVRGVDDERGSEAERGSEGESGAPIGRQTGEEGRAEGAPPIEQETLERPEEQEPSVVHAPPRIGLGGVDVESQSDEGLIEDKPPPRGDTPVCDLVLAAGTEEREPVYPRGGRMNFGNAKVTVRYIVDDLGETVDQQVHVLRESSQADRERYFELFAESAVETVQEWKFGFAIPDGQSCTRRQHRTTSFRFTYR